MPISAVPGGARAATVWKPRLMAAARRFACTTSTAGFRFTPDGTGVRRTRLRRREPWDRPGRPGRGNPGKPWVNPGTDPPVHAVQKTHLGTGRSVPGRYAFC